MHDADRDMDTRRLISLAAERFDGPDSDVGELPYDDPGIDAAFLAMGGHLRRVLGTRLAGFMHEVLDEASTMFASIGEGDGKGWHVEARLFAMVASGPPDAVASLATMDGMGRMASAIGGTGLAPRTAKLAFVPFPLPLSVLDDLSPGRLRRVTHCLASRVVPGFPPAAQRDPRAALGMSETSFAKPQYAARPGSVTRAIVGVRCTRARPDRRMSRDWFSRFDASDVADGAQGAWEVDMANGHGADVGLPMPWMEVAGLVAADHVVGTLAAEAVELGFDLDFGKGTVHHCEEDATLAVALALPDGRVLGPARASRDSMLGGLDVLSSILGASGRDSYRHVTPGSLSRLVMRGASRRSDDAGGAGDAPFPGYDDGEVDGLPAIH